MRTINISTETTESLFRDILVSDYKMLLEDIFALESRISMGEKIEDFELEDLEDWKRFAEAMEVMLEYYVAGYEEIIENSRLT